MSYISQNRTTGHPRRDRCPAVPNLATRSNTCSSRSEKATNAKGQHNCHLDGQMAYFRFACGLKSGTFVPPAGHFAKNVSRQRDIQRQSGAGHSGVYR